MNIPFFLYIFSIISWYIYITINTDSRKYKLEKLKQDFVKYCWHRFLYYSYYEYWVHQDSLHKLIYWHKEYYNTLDYKITNIKCGISYRLMKKDINMICDLRRLFCANKDKIHYCWVLNNSLHLNNLPPEVLIQIEKYF